MSVEEYQSQLSDIEILLADSPEDESLLKLKSDLLELIELTCADQQSDEMIANDGLTSSNDLASASQFSSEDAAERPAGAAEISPPSGHADADADDASTKIAGKADKKKKNKKIKDFEIPEHLLPLESDTEAQRNKKRRTVKSLKSKHKAAQKEYQSNKKQASWLEISKKKRKKGRSGESIFKMAAEGGKVGVVNSTGANEGRSDVQGASSKRQRHVF